MRKVDLQKLFVTLERDGAVCTRCNQEGQNVQVLLAEEEVIALSYMDGTIFEIINKFAKAGFDLGRYTVEAEFGPTLTSAIRKLNELFPEGEAGHGM